jgi:hypothetical protein
VSGHVRKLADAVGLPLLELHDRRVVPTAAGQALLEAARDIFAALHRADTALAAARLGHQDDEVEGDAPAAATESPGSADPIGTRPGQATARTGERCLPPGQITRLRSTQVWA